MNIVRNLIVAVFGASLAACSAGGGGGVVPGSPNSSGGANAPGTPSGPSSVILNVQIQEYPTPFRAFNVAIAGDGNPWMLATNNALETYRNAAFTGMPLPPSFGGLSLIGPMVGDAGAVDYVTKDSSDPMKPYFALAQTTTQGLSQLSSSFAFVGYGGGSVDVKIDPVDGTIWWGAMTGDTLQSLVLGGTFANGVRAANSFPNTAEVDVYAIAVGTDAIYAYAYYNPQTSAHRSTAVTRRMRGRSGVRPQIAGGMNAVLKLSKANASLLAVYPAPSASSPSMASTPDGNIWFSDQATNSIYRMTPAGSFAQFTVPTPNAGVGQMVRGGDGAIWFVETDAPHIGRIDPILGKMKEYPIPSGQNAVSISAPTPLVVCTQNVLWFVTPTTLGQLTFSVH